MRHCGIMKARNSVSRSSNKTITIFPNSLPIWISNACRRKNKRRKEIKEFVNRKLNIESHDLPSNKYYVSALRFPFVTQHRYSISFNISIYELCISRVSPRSLCPRVSMSHHTYTQIAFI